jgi:hypothetical protein
MRGLKSTIALLALLVGLGAYIYFVTWKKTDSSTLAKKESVFAGLETGQIEELTVKSEKGEITSLKKSGDKWQITQPAETPAADSDVAVVTSAIGQMEINRVVDEKPADLKEYGPTAARPRGKSSSAIKRRLRGISTRRRAMRRGCSWWPTTSKHR